MKKTINAANFILKAFSIIGTLFFLFVMAICVVMPVMFVIEILFFFWEYPAGVQPKTLLATEL